MVDDGQTFNVQRSTVTRREATDGVPTPQSLDYQIYERRPFYLLELHPEPERRPTDSTRILLVIGFAQSVHG